MCTVDEFLCTYRILFSDNRHKLSVAAQRSQSTVPIGSDGAPILSPSLVVTLKLTHLIHSDSVDGFRVTVATNFRALTHYIHLNYKVGHE
jgi:hypothetical protein